MLAIVLIDGGTIVCSLLMGISYHYHTNHESDIAVLLVWGLPPELHSPPRVRAQELVARCSAPKMDVQCAPCSSVGFCRAMLGLLVCDLQGA